MTNIEQQKAGCALVIIRDDLLDAVESSADVNQIIDPESGHICNMKVAGPLWRIFLGVA